MIKWLRNLLFPPTYPVVIGEETVSVSERYVNKARATKVALLHAALVDDGEHSPLVSYYQDTIKHYDEMLLQVKKQKDTGAWATDKGGGSSYTAADVANLIRDKEKKEPKGKPTSCRYWKVYEPYGDLIETYDIDCFPSYFNRYDVKRALETRGHRPDILVTQSAYPVDDRGNPAPRHSSKQDYTYPLTTDVYDSDDGPLPYYLIRKNDK